MNTKDIAHIRLHTQQIAASAFKSPGNLVQWMGVLQAQDYAMAKWAIGIRVPNATEQTINNAIHTGDIIRTHVLRPTWHFVSRYDIHWMLALSAPKIKSTLPYYHRQLDITNAILKKSNKVIEKALTSHKHLTRNELVVVFKKANIAVDNNRAIQLLFWAELEGLICSGELKDKEPTYTLLDAWVPKKQSFTREESIAELARRYFNSHAPATLHDFAWWAGLTVAESKAGMEAIQAGFIAEKIDSQTYWLPNNFSLPVQKQKTACLLPAYDEFIVSYTDRSAIFTSDIQPKVITTNGLFRPVLLINGHAAGIWKRTIKKDKVTVNFDFFTTPPKTANALIKKAVKAYGEYCDMEISGF